MQTTYIVLDCYNIGHIAFHAMGNLDHHGRKTGIVFGFMYRMLDLAKRYETGNFIFCWDSQQSHRKIAYPPYKDRGDRKMVIRGTGEVIDYQAFHGQMEDIRKNVLSRLGFANSYMATGYEADDIMAAVVNRFPVDPGIHFVLATTDRDMYQCLGGRVSIYNIRAKKAFTLDDFVKRYGIQPHQWVEAKAIGGCSSDTIKGVGGVADPATSQKSRALAYLKGELTHGNAYRDITSELGKEIIARNRKLIKLPYNNIHIKELQEDALSRNAFLTLFDELGFNSFLKKEVWHDWEKHFGLYK